MILVLQLSEPAGPHPGYLYRGRFDPKVDLFLLVWQPSDGHYLSNVQQYIDIIFVKIEDIIIDFDVHHRVFKYGNVGWCDQKNINHKITVAI